MRRLLIVADSGTSIIARVLLLSAMLLVCVGSVQHSGGVPRSTVCGPLDPCLPARPDTAPTFPQEPTWFGVQRTIADLMAATPAQAPVHPKVAAAVDIPLERFGTRLSSLVSGTPSTADASAMTVDLTFVGALGYPLGIPDTMGAVGPTQYLVVLNTVIRSFNKTTGIKDGVLDMNFGNFFVGGAIDPKVRYDRLSGRWFIAALMYGDYPNLSPNWLHLAVSSGGVLTKQTVWTFFKFRPAEVNPVGDTGCFADYTRMSVDAKAVYLVFGMFNSTVSGPCPGNSTGSTAFVIRKTSVLGNGPMVATAFRGSGYFAVPVDQFEPDSTVGYIATSFSAYGNRSYYRVLDPGGSPTLSGEVTYAETPFLGNPTDGIRHKGNVNETGVPSNPKGRLWLGNGISHSLPLRRGRLWVADARGVDNQGEWRQFPDGSTATTRTGLRFTELRDLATGPPVVAQTGLLFTPSAANDFDQRNYWMPAIMVSGQGHVVLAGSVAGTNEYANAFVASRLATDPPGTLRTPFLYTAAAAAYAPNYPDGGYRWGDYSNISLDPSDDMTMWTIQQFTATPDVWAVAVARIRAPPPPSQWSFTPNVIPLNSSSVNIAVTGTPNDGEGFYDPGLDTGGPGFSNHLSATVAGGVVVNSVSFVDATHVVLNVSTVGATSGIKLVTITNPDGQAVTGTAILAAGGMFSDDALQAGSTPVKAVHVTEIRQYIASLRSRYGLAAAAWTDPTVTPGVTVIKAVHITELRARLAEVYAAASLSPPTYGATAPSSIITAANISEIRAAVKAIY